MAKYLETYDELHKAGGDVGFIANVFLNRGRPGTAISALSERVKRGDEIGAVAYRLPSECFYLNGYVVKGEILYAGPNAHPVKFLFKHSA